MIAETDKLPLLKPRVRKDDSEDDESDYEVTPEEKAKLEEILAAYLVGVGVAINAGQQMGLVDSANAGAIAAGGGLTAAEVAQAVESAANFNADHFSGLQDDATQALQDLIDSGDYANAEDLANQVSDLLDAIASRAERYAKGGGNYAWGTALRMAGEANDLEGGIWDQHWGPGSCGDCSALHGQWMTWDEWEATYQNTECDGGCNCGFHAAANPDSIDIEDLGPEDPGNPLPPEEEAA